MARPLNDDVDDASLRLERGSAQFLKQSANWLFDNGAPSVLSVPLHPGTRKVWDQAGFVPHRQLLLMERDLSFDVAPPDHAVVAGNEQRWEEALDIDNRSFEAEWRIGELGLVDARDATPRSHFVVVIHDGEAVGFSITGIAQSTAYLQRIAVEPIHRNKGIGRSLLRASIRWAKDQAARSILLNTQLENHGAARLYKTERFEALPQHLVLLKATPP